ARLANALDGRLGKRVARFLQSRDSGEVPFVGKRGADRLEDREGRLGHLGADAVARDERDGDRRRGPGGGFLRRLGLRFLLYFDGHWRLLRVRVGDYTVCP